MGVVNCALCLSHVDSENAEILTMGAYGTPKYLCNECSDELNRITLGKSYTEIKASMDNLTKAISQANIDDRRTLECIGDIFDNAIERANQIKDGTYDFAKDEEKPTEIDDLPEELAETEEDRLLDEKDAVVAKKWDRILNYVSFAILAAAVGFFVYYFLS